VRRRHRLVLTAAAAATVLASGPVAAFASAAAPTAPAWSRLPARVYAPYFETWMNESIPVVSARSGAKYFTLAFIQSAGKKGANACTLTWNGNPKQPISMGRYTQEIASLRAHGGDVIPSFGGYSADEGGTEIADSCKSVPQIAADYEQVVSIYGVSELDMDVEANSLTNYAGIARRSEAIAMAQRWARARGIRLRIQFTIGIEPNGLDKFNLGVVRSAVAHGVRVSSVNLMVFDYYLNSEPKPLDMGKLAIEAVSNAHRQLTKVFRLTGAAVWRLEGMTMLPGIDDYPGKTEVTHLTDALAMRQFARAHRMDFLSIWAIQRDDGQCPGVIDSNTCSGIAQRAWDFSHLLEPFTS